MLLADPNKATLCQVNFCSRCCLLDVAQVAAPRISFCLCVRCPSDCLLARRLLSVDCDASRASLSFVSFDPPRVSSAEDLTRVRKADASTATGFIFTYVYVCCSRCFLAERCAALVTLVLAWTLFRLFFAMWYVRVLTVSFRLDSSAAGTHS